MARADALDALDALLDERDRDAFLKIDDATDSDMYYLSGFEAGDDFVFLRRPGESVLLVPQLEVGRAREEAAVDAVRSFGEFVDDDVRGDREATLAVVAEFLSTYDPSTLAVPRGFAVYDAAVLEEAGYAVEPVGDAVMDARTRKSAAEIDHLRAAQAATEDAMARAEELLSGAEIEGGVLHHGGEPLTAGRVRAEIEVALVREGCRLEQTIVAPGPGGADPHWSGEGPIRAGEPVIIDIFPRHPTKYHGDMTRTFLRGEPSPEVREMYDATLDAQQAAFEVLEGGAGVTGAAVHDAVCEVYEARGYDTIREGAETSGFVHSTGHAIGLDVHEPPRLAGGCGPLEAGYALTIEPGLYDPEIGGVRVEDMVIVTEDGFENLNSYGKELVL